MLLKLARVGLGQSNFNLMSKIDNLYARAMRLCQDIKEIELTRPDLKSASVHADDLAKELSKLWRDQA